MKNKRSRYAKQVEELRVIPGVGVSIANDLVKIGVFSVIDLIGRNPEKLYRQTNELVRSSSGKMSFVCF